MSARNVFFLIFDDVEVLDFTGPTLPGPEKPGAATAVARVLLRFV